MRLNKKLLQLGLWVLFGGIMQPQVAAQLPLEQSAHLHSAETQAFFTKHKIESVTSVVEDELGKRQGQNKVLLNRAGQAIQLLSSTVYGGVSTTSQTWWRIDGSGQVAERIEKFSDTGRVYRTLLDTSESNGNKTLLCKYDWQLCERHTYDSNGRIAEIGTVLMNKTDSLFPRRKRFTYDQAGRKSTEEDVELYPGQPLHRITLLRFAYDQNGRLLSETYDGLTPEVEASGTMLSNKFYRYDSAGRLVERRTKGLVMRFTYSKDGLLSTSRDELDPEGTGNPTVIIRRYSYTFYR